MKDRTGLPKEHVVVDIQNCARCGKNHKQLKFSRLCRHGPRHNFWAPCPTNGEPIMMRVEVTPDKPEKEKKPRRKLTWKQKGWFSPTQRFGPRNLDC